jgi:hypothetical protein
MTAAVIEVGRKTIQGERAYVVAALPSEVGVAPPGHTATVAWTAAAGATSAEVTSAQATIGPALAVESVATIPFSGSGNERVITPPSGRRIRSLTLSKLALPDGSALTNENDLRAADRRIVISLPDPRGGWAPPQFSAPSVDSRGMLPRSLTGAAYSAGVLTLPDVAASRLRLTLASGDFPESFAPQAFALAGISGQLAAASRDLTLVDESGATLWTFPGELPPDSPLAEVDLRVPLETTFEKALAVGAPIEAVLTLRAAAAPARARFRLGAVRGALIREAPGVTSYALDGSARPIDLGPEPLAGEAPTAASADVRVRYDGLRLHESIRDPVPDNGAAGGLVVEQEPVLRAFPPAAFAQLPPGRLGVIGRAPEECELSVSLVEAQGGGSGRVLAGPAVAELEPASELGLHWFELPELTPPVPPAAMLVRATRGRFLWVAAEQPAARVAVRDPDPGGRALTLGGVRLLDVAGPDAVALAHSLPAAVLQGPPPPLESDLFLTVEVGSVTLRYAR